MNRTLQHAVLAVATLGVTMAVLSARAPGSGRSQDVRTSPTVERPQVAPPPHPAGHAVPTIDGETNPEAIPDNVAQRMFLKMMMTPDIERHAGRMQRSYVRHVLRTGAVLGDPSHTDHTGENCNVHKTARPTDAEVEEVVRFVHAYEGRLRAIDRARRAVREKGDIAAARRLNASRDALVDEVVRSMPERLGQRTTAKLEAYVRLRFKKSTKIFNPAGHPARHTVEEGHP